MSVRSEQLRQCTSALLACIACLALSRSHSVCRCPSHSRQVRTLQSWSARGFLLSCCDFRECIRSQLLVQSERLPLSRGGHSADHIREHMRSQVTAAAMEQRPRVSMSDESASVIRVQLGHPPSAIREQVVEMAQQEQNSSDCRRCKSRADLSFNATCAHQKKPRGESSALDEVKSFAAADLCVCVCVCVLNASRLRALQ